MTLEEYISLTGGPDLSTKLKEDKYDKPLPSAKMKHDSTAYTKKQLPLIWAIRRNR